MVIQANGNYHHFFIRIPILYFATFWSILSKKNHVLVVAVELIWFLFLNILSFNFVQTPNQSLRFRRCRRNYVHHSVFVPTNHCQIFTACFCLMCAVQSGHIPFFCRCLSPMILHLRNLFSLSTTIARMLLLIPRWVNRHKDVK